jgi:hypothetical protein
MQTIYSEKEVESTTYLLTEYELKGIVREWISKEKKLKGAKITVHLENEIDQTKLPLSREKKVCSIVASYTAKSLFRRLSGKKQLKQKSFLWTE